MNRFMEERWSWIEGCNNMRTQLLDSLTDEDLTFSPGGSAISLGALFREMGEIEYSYLQSLKTFTQDWSYRNTEAGLENSVSQLKAWFTKLDDELKAVVDAFSNDDLTKGIDRSGYPMPVETQLEVYVQAMLIIFGKATVYFRAMDKPLPETVEQWIG